MEMGNFNKIQVPDDLKVVAFVVARLSSSRFPAKHLSMIGNQRLIDWTVAGLKQSEQINQIVITTVAEPENDPLRQVALDHEIGFFWYEGEVDHVTTRLRKAAEEFDADICLLISGDCPLIDGELVDHLVCELKENTSADYVVVMPDASGGVPMSEGVGVYRKSAWQRGDDLSDRPEFKEHHFPVIERSPALFQAIHAVLPAQYYGVKHRLSVDTQADLVFMNKAYAELRDQGRQFKLTEVTNLINGNEKLRQINAHVHQRQLVEKIRRVLFVVDAAGPMGLENLERSIVLGHQLVERISYPVCFMVDDLDGLNVLHSHVFGVHWGALGREVNPAPADVVSHRQVPLDIDLVILDINSARLLGKDWRGSLHKDCAVIILGSLAGVPKEMSPINMPGATNITFYEDLRKIVQSIQESFNPEK